MGWDAVKVPFYYEYRSKSRVDCHVGIVVIRRLAGSWLVIIFSWKQIQITSVAQGSQIADRLGGERTSFFGARRQSAFEDDDRLQSKIDDCPMASGLYSSRMIDSRCIGGRALR